MDRVRELVDALARHPTVIGKLRDDPAALASTFDLRAHTAVMRGVDTFFESEKPILDGPLEGSHPDSAPPEAPAAAWDLPMTFSATDEPTWDTHTATDCHPDSAPPEAPAAAWDVPIACGVSPAGAPEIDLTADPGTSSLTFSDGSTPRSAGRDASSRHEGVVAAAAC